MAPFNPSTDPSTEALKHGMSIECENRQVQCCYCGVVVPGFNPLQQHLGCIGGDVAECPDVPENVKDYFRSSLLANKVSRKGKKKVTFDEPGSSSKRLCTATRGSEMNPNPIQMSDSRPQFAISVESDMGVDESWRSRFIDLPLGCSFGLASNDVFASLLKENNTGSNLARSVGSDLDPAVALTSRQIPQQARTIALSTGVRATDFSASNAENPVTGRSIRANGFSVSDVRQNTRTGRSTAVGPVNSSASKARKRSTGRFFFENAIDFSAVTSSSFKNLIRVLPNRDETICSLPSIDELKGWIFDAELEDIIDYVNQIRLTWAETGCSILLDGWTDQSGRDLINVVVDCPAGPIYLCSGDVSPSKGDDALLLFLESVINEVGIKNIVQIVAHTSSETLNAVREKLTGKYKSLFWMVSGTCCLSMILDLFAADKLIKHTIKKAKTITRFIYGSCQALDLTNRCIHPWEPVRPSKIKAVTPFLTLQSLLFSQTKLKNMSRSSEWLDSRWGSTPEGRKVGRIIRNDDFWSDVTTAVKASMPVVKTMILINGQGESSLGFIYETMDQIKEMISALLGETHQMKIRCWKMIDKIWDEILHNNLHSAALILNPKYYYSRNFRLNSGNFTGMLAILGMADQGGRTELLRQLSLYQNHKDGFQSGIQSENSYSPAAWWGRFGHHVPELHRIAIRLQSQKCIGAESYELRRDVAEKLLSDTRRNAIEHQNLFNFTCLHYNLKLKQFEKGPNFNILADQIDPSDDWIVGATRQAEAVTPVRPVVFKSSPPFRTGSGLGRGKFEKGGPSSGPLGKDPKRKA